MKLQKKRREREVKQYGYEKCAEVLIAYILKGKTQREIDEEILAPRRATQNGFDANAILGHFGITKDFSKDFVGMSVNEFIETLKTFNDSNFEEIITLLSSYQENQILKDIELETQEGHPVEEGGRIMYYTARYERNAKNRKLAIAHHGTTCKVCGFDFEKVYGELGKDYIEVHHLVPLSERNEKVIPDPKTEMTVLCSNCHRMIHRKGILKPDELKKLLDEQTLKV